MAHAMDRSPASIQSQVAQLTMRDPPDRWSCVRGNCGFYAARMRRELAAQGQPARLAFVGGTGYHYHVRVYEHVVVCPTWLQWIEGEYDPALPRIFVGTRDALVRALEPYAASLPADSFQVLGLRPRSTPDSLVDEQYGFGARAAELRDAGVQEEALLRNRPKEYLLSLASIDGR